MAEVTSLEMEGQTEAAEWPEVTQTRDSMDSGNISTLVLAQS